MYFILQEELEVVDLTDVKLVYGTSFFKGLATGGNVSKAMAKAGERATYGSIATFTNQMLLLGKRFLSFCFLWSKIGKVFRRALDRRDTSVIQTKSCQINASWSWT